MGKIICTECGREGTEESKDFSFCCDCEEFYCFHSGCKWIDDYDGLSVCQNCFPEDTEAKFILFTDSKKLDLGGNSFIPLNSPVSEAIEMLKKKGYEYCYRLEVASREIVKYGKKCGIYFVVDGINVSHIGVWAGEHKTETGIKLYSPKEKVTESYGENLTVEGVDGYITTCYYSDHNLRFKFTRIGAEKEIVTEFELG